MIFMWRIPLTSSCLFYRMLSEKYSFSFWEKMDEDHSAVRVCTSWATKEENIDALIEDLKKF